MRAVDLGRATKWEKSRLSHHLGRMEKRGLIRREEGEARYPHIVLTERGWDAIRTCAPANASRVRELFVEPIGPDRLNILNQAFNDVIAAVRDHEDIHEIT